MALTRCASCSASTNGSQNELIIGQRPTCSKLASCFRLELTVDRLIRISRTRALQLEDKKRCGMKKRGEMVKPPVVRRTVEWKTRIEIRAGTLPAPDHKGCRPAYRICRTGIPLLDPDRPRCGLPDRRQSLHPLIPLRSRTNGCSIRRSGSAGSRLLLECEGLSTLGLEGPPFRPT